MPVRNSNEEMMSQVLGVLVRWGRGIGVGVLLIILLLKLGFSVTNSEVVALTYVNGRVAFFTEAGLYGQWFGSVTSFSKRDKYDFQERIQFLDGAHATIKGSVQYEVPLDVPHLTDMYAKYPTPLSIKVGLIETNLQKAVYLTGRMMTSKESYAEKKGDLLYYMEDQLANGVYQTRTRNIEVPDDLDRNKTKQLTVTEIVITDGKQIRQEKGLLDTYNIKTSNFSMEVTYDPEVENQIQSMQKLTQDINQSIADAKKAEQRSITAAKNGEATAAEAKWEQEKLNAKVQAEADQKVRTAKAAKESAEFNKQAAILEGQGESERKRLVMAADGALTQKLEAYKYAVDRVATAIEKHQGPWVPGIVMGGSNGGAYPNAATQFMDMLTIDAAKRLGVSMAPSKE